MEQSDIDDPKAKAKADREKFESVKKIEISPILKRGSIGQHKLDIPKLQSPDEKNPKWITDPEEIMAAKKAAKKVKSDPNTQT